MAACNEPSRLAQARAPAMAKARSFGRALRRLDWRVLLVGYAAGASLSCGGTVTSAEAGIPVPISVPEGVIATAGVAIWAHDSSFRLDSGLPFATPFFAPRCVKEANAQNYRKGREAGARPVVVQVPGLPEPLFGLLAFCRVPSLATGPATRSYRLEVPEQYVAATEGGRVSVVYEPTDYEDYPAWQLWLARTPSLWQ